MATSSKPPNTRTRRKRLRGGVGKTQAQQEMKAQAVTPRAYETVFLPAEPGELQRRAIAWANGEPMALPFGVDDIPLPDGRAAWGQAEMLLFQRRLWVQKLVNRQHSFEQIAAWLGVSLTAVYDDFRWNVEQLKLQAVRETTDTIRRLVQQAEERINVAWDAFYRSQRPQEETIEESGMRGDKPVELTRTIRKPARDGNPKFMEVIRRESELIARLLGILDGDGGGDGDAPTDLDGRPMVRVTIVHEEKPLPSHVAQQRATRDDGEEFA